MILCLEEPFYLLSFGSRRKLHQISSTSVLVRVFDCLHRAVLCSVPTCNVTGILWTHSHAALQFDSAQLLDHHQWAWTECSTRKGLHPHSWWENWTMEKWPFGGCSAMQGQNYPSRAQISGVFLGLDGASVPSEPLEWFKASRRPPLNVSCVTRSSSSLM